MSSISDAPRSEPLAGTTRAQSTTLAVALADCTGAHHLEHYVAPADNGVVLYFRHGAAAMAFLDRAADAAVPYQPIEKTIAAGVDLS